MIHNKDYRAFVKEVIHSNGLLLTIEQLPHLEKQFALCLDVEIIAYLEYFQVYLNKITCAQKMFKQEVNQ